MIDTLEIAIKAYRTRHFSLDLTQRTQGSSNPVTCLSHVLTSKHYGLSFSSHTSPYHSPLKSTTSFQMPFDYSVWIMINFGHPDHFSRPTHALRTPCIIFFRRRFLRLHPHTTTLPLSAQVIRAPSIKERPIAFPIRALRRVGRSIRRLSHSKGANAPATVRYRHSRQFPALWSCCKLLQVL